MRLSVQDAGVGFDSRAADRLFEAFYTTKKEGMGLGLSFVVTILDHHKATLEIRSEPLRGTVFLMRFPAAKGV